MSFAGIIGLALVIDVLFGWPARLYERIGHPVTWIGALITALDHRWNRGGLWQQRGGGTLIVLVLLAVGTLPAMALQAALPDGIAGLLLGAVLAWPWIAARSLHDHVAAVAAPLVRGDLPAARQAVAMIVGRDPAQLDTTGVTLAALESLAENASDGVVAPLFWGLLGGLPGLVAYKVVNTLDSMIGHRNPRYEEFGKVAARLDDAMNLIPARLTALLIALVAGRGAVPIRVMMRDARNHRSPNAGWPESALAGALDVRLSGPRAYGDRVSDEPWLNDGAPDPAPEALERGLAVYLRAVGLCGVGLLFLAII
ncbi:adenosylcobinamide-phosphate synthase CbiB [Aquibaculum sediminis]|uniref:adenosylcobinamide-phosphate synthase CbiB n=1 Tax=Aquibaculum sediminis TaxID=3231907 RepID=UPI0034559F37